MRERPHSRVAVGHVTIANESKKASFPITLENSSFHAVVHVICPRRKNLELELWHGKKRRNAKSIYFQADTLMKGMELPVTIDGKRMGNGGTAMKVGKIERSLGTNVVANGHAPKSCLRFLPSLRALALL